ncbi:sulfotransferase domain-containing protein [Nocardioides sp. LHG3406-4]|uniref:sulfotransferase domain-containing protein n=1 Tax=Nocardioides sp. LHG3406-4 TaxID=2804575 RepID=UPI003CF1ED08
MPAETDEPPLGWQRYTFSIVGVQKAGTSTLSSLLDTHVNIARAPRKELRYFDDDSVDWEHTDHAAYAVARRRRAHQQMGDASPRYLVWPHALERMHAYNPAMRLIALFRDPIDRVFSHWVMTRTREGEAGPDWPEFIAWRPAGLPSEIPHELGGPEARGRFRRANGVVRGYYGSQLRRGFEVFDREQWLLMDFVSFLADHERHLDLATDHIGVRRFAEHPPLKHLMAAAGPVTGTAPTGEDLISLASSLRGEVEEFARLSGLDVAHWTTTRLLAGTLDPDEQAGRYAAKAGLTPR